MKYNKYSFGHRFGKPIVAEGLHLSKALVRFAQTAQLW